MQEHPQIQIHISNTINILTEKEDSKFIHVHEYEYSVCMCVFWLNGQNMYCIPDKEQYQV